MYTDYWTVKGFPNEISGRLNIQNRMEYTNSRYHFYGGTSHRSFNYFVAYLKDRENNRSLRKENDRSTRREKTARPRPTLRLYRPNRR